MVTAFPALYRIFYICPYLLLPLNAQPNVPQCYFAPHVNTFKKVLFVLFSLFHYICLVLYPTRLHGRWVPELNPFNWTIVGRDDVLHTNAEALSFWPVSSDPTHLQDSQTSMHMVGSVDSKQACINQRPAYSLFYSVFELQSS